MSITGSIGVFATLPNAKGFLDKIGMGIYPNIILILSSNKSIHEIDKMDPCYLRKGRVNIVSELIDEKFD